MKSKTKTIRKKWNLDENTGQCFYDLTKQVFLNIKIKKALNIL